MANEKLSEALKGNTNAAKNHAKKGMQAISDANTTNKTTVGKYFANTSQKVKTAWEAVDKTVKYGAAGAAAGAVGTGILGFGSPAAKAVSLGKVATAYGVAGTAAGGIIGGAQATGSGLSIKDKIKSAAAGAGIIGTTMSASGVASNLAMRAIGTPTPAKMVAGAVVGGAIGAYKGYKADRAEEAEVISRKKMAEETGKDNIRRRMWGV